MGMVTINTVSVSRVGSTRSGARDGLQTAGTVCCPAVVRGTGPPSLIGPAVSGRPPDKPAATSTAPAPVRKRRSRASVSTRIDGARRMGRKGRSRLAL